MAVLGLVLLAGAVVIDVLAERWRAARDQGLADIEAERSHRALMHELRRLPRDG